MERKDLGKTDAHHWLRKAQWRMAECETEIRKLPEAQEGRRRAKIARRLDLFRDLVSDLQAGGGQDPQQDLDELEAEVNALRFHIRQAALALVAAKEEWKELRTRWGHVADEIMKQREEKGEPAGRVPRLDFRFPPPPPEAPPEEREAHGIIRSIKL